MTVVTLICQPDLIEKMQTYYADYSQPLVQYSTMRAKKNGVMITAYTSGKVVFQGVLAQDEAAIWQDQSQTSSAEQDKKQIIKHNLPKDFDQWTIIGSDEVGNGSYFGPLTVCAVYLPKEQQALVKEYGVKDSKALSDKQIIEIANYLKETVNYHLTNCPPIKYNEANQTRNANGIKVSLHNFTLQKLWAKLNDQQRQENQGILIDQFVAEETYYKHLQKEAHPFQEKIYFVEKGESHHLAVACASIIARAAFLESLVELGKPFGLALPSGAGANVDVFGRKLVAKFGAKVLPQLAKMHFKNTQKILKK